LILADRPHLVRTRLCYSVLRPSISSSSVTLCIVAKRRKRCVLEQKLLLRAAYRKSYMRNRLVPKWMTLTFV